MSTSDAAAGAPIEPAALAVEIARLANEMFASKPQDLSGVATVPPGALPVNAYAASGAPQAIPAAPPASPGLGNPGVVLPPGLGPNALNVGAGGASSAVSLPPVPGPLHSLPLAAAPAPKVSDLRAIPTLTSENLGTSTPVQLAGGDPGPAVSPYFLGIAGLPSGYAPNAAGLRSALPALPSAGPALPSAAPLPGGAPSLASVPSLPGAVPTFPGAVPTLPGAVPTLPGAVPTLPGGAPSLGSVPSLPGAVPSPLGVSPAPPVSGRELAVSRAFEFVPELVAAPAQTRGAFDPHAVRRDFPILEERVHGRRLVWFDNAATTQKPRAVIERLSYFYEHENSNIHRAAHALAARATDAYEAARDKVRRFLNAASPQEIVFVRGTTEGINLIAQSWGRRHVGAGDEIVITWLEHHANIVPWQQLAAEKGARLRVAPVDDRGQIILEEYEKLFNSRTRLVSVSQVSNALGTITPAKHMVEIAHRYGACTVVDGAQAVSHMAVDVQALDCDFYVFSGHKIFGPTGIGAVYGKRDVLNAMPPWQGGGNMIRDVTFERTSYHDAPLRFEAGTGNIADAVGLGAALDYVSAIGLPNISRYEHELLEYATGELTRIPGLTLIGTAAEKAGVLSFVLDGMSTEDVGKALDQEGIAVRAGHHCAQPILRRFGLESTVRASLAPYNTPSDVDALVAALRRIRPGR
jgi:cysteine desulfurase / selenocysteine lyase